MENQVAGNKGMEMAAGQKKTNQVLISGTVQEPFSKSHESYGESFYQTTVAVTRLSGVADLLNVMVSERLVDVSKDLTGKKIRVEGQFRSYNQTADEHKSRLLLVVFAKRVELLDAEGNTEADAGTAAVATGLADTAEDAGVVNTAEDAGTANAAETASVAETSDAAENDDVCDDKKAAAEDAGTASLAETAGAASAAEAASMAETADAAEKDGVCDTKKAAAEDAGTIPAADAAGGKASEDAAEPEAAAGMLTEAGSQYDENEIVLDGYICKAPIYRKTPLGREICDVILAVNRRYGRSDYIPCIAWGRNACFMAGLDVGTRLEVTGRIQSREFFKAMGEGVEPEKRRAYEVSISLFHQIREELGVVGEQKTA